jgi:hypothetical protein
VYILNNFKVLTYNIIFEDRIESGVFILHDSKSAEIMYRKNTACNINYSAEFLKIPLPLQDANP